MVDILLATYNGEKYLKNQILSLLGQTYSNWRLLIHDDGSTDNTLNIIEYYARIYSNIILVRDSITGLGAAQNFLHLLKYAESEFIMFCDQDDIWFESKVEEMVNAIQSLEQPSAVYCNAFAYKSFNIVSPKVTLIFPTNIQNTLFLNGGIQGCSIIINRKLKQLIGTPPPYVHMHDHLITLAAVSFGYIKYLDRSLMLYRQHDTNVTGNYETVFLRRVRNFFKSNGTVLDKGHYLAVKSFFDTYSGNLSKEQRKYFEAYFEFAATASKLKRLWIVYNYGFKISESRLTLLFKTAIRKAIN